ncbi:LANO_0D00232g1_1 [Lachancea nothofagi CBS 11611]|uniref:LANO_0D00232g1_1 n=1 Tax=Lachancea nothofagi CBS 11611 TaxID=1266666 RepID=A0A1G4JCJ4_9SACH|nr:LANO_0D00232g1_1 [Lachancea nothofagi CBS 11611]
MDVLIYNIKIIFKMTCNSHKKYTCPLSSCQKAYSKPCLLREHTRSHNNERPFVCSEPHCEKRFLRVCHLNVHKWSHTKSKPLKCDNCSKRFTTKQQLSRHKTTHDKKRRAATNVTALGAGSSKLTDNFCPAKSDNEPLKVFNCSYDACGESFEMEWELTEHLLDMHILSVIAPENCELSMPPSLNVSEVEQDNKLIEAFFEKCEDLFTKDYVSEAQLWVDLRCKHPECLSWVASSYCTLIEHYEEFHKAVPVSLLQYGFDSIY